MKAYFLQRIVSYIIDIFIVTFIVSAITFFIPISEEYDKAYETAKNTISDYTAGKIDSDKYFEDYSIASYTMAKETSIHTVISLLVTTAYFGTYAYYKKGQTLGKKLMKIKITTLSGEDVSHNTMILRTLLIYGVITSAVSLILIQFLDSSQYFRIGNMVQGVQSLFVLVSMFMVMFRKDGKGLHDLICKTHVISLK